MRAIENAFMKVWNQRFFSLVNLLEPCVCVCGFNGQVIVITSECFEEKKALMKRSKMDLECFLGKGLAFNGWILATNLCITVSSGDSRSILCHSNQVQIFQNWPMLRCYSLSSTGDEVSLQTKDTYLHSLECECVYSFHSPFTQLIITNCCSNLKYNEEKI